ncbi:MAG: hypothetical protein QOJ60_852 [Actinomycetota bacterium]|nr:hypothetical protein [Actinomycetota bacterium]
MAEADPAPPRELTDEEFHSIYGPSDPLSPAGARDLFDGAPFPWWVVGGWAVELGGGAPREHEDIEVSVARRDLAAVRRWLHPLHVWDIHGGDLRYLAPDDPEPPEEHEQRWVRRDGFSPWILDLLVTPVQGDDWVYKRDHRLRRSLSEVIRRTPDGVPYQRPEIALLFKARLMRDKDRADFAGLVPVLDDDSRKWLRAALELTHAGHEWVDQL